MLYRHICCRNHWISPDSFLPNYHSFPWGIHGAAIYGVPWIPSIYTLYVSIIPAPWILSFFGWILNHSLFVNLVYWIFRSSHPEIFFNVLYYVILLYYNGKYYTTILCYTMLYYYTILQWHISDKFGAILQYMQSYTTMILYYNVSPCFSKIPYLSASCPPWIIFLEKAMDPAGMEATPSLACMGPRNRHVWKGEMMINHKTLQIFRVSFQDKLMES